MNETANCQPCQGDLVRRRWVTRGQKERWVAMLSSTDQRDPDGCGLVIENETGPHQSGTGFCTVLWHNGQQESVRIHLLTVVQRAR